VLTVGAGLAAPASADADRLEIVASAPVVELHQPVTIAGTLTAAASCTGGRALLLEWRPADSDAFAILASGSAAADGTFRFEQAQRYSGWYRVVAPATDACTEVVSDAVPVRVRARVESAILAGSLTAGRCLEVTVRVKPPKPGQRVELQRRSGGTWATVEELTLGPDSAASARPCFGWEDVGVVRLRASWPAQDRLNARGISAPLAFEIGLAGWMERIAALVGDRQVSLSVGEAGEFLFGLAPRVPRTPASNEKLLLAMALLDTLGPRFRIRTLAATEAALGPVIEGDLWILGRGDPGVDRGTMRALARRIARAGVRRVQGRVLGATTYFLRDWDAVGWDDDARRYVALPTALTFEGNLDRLGRKVLDPEVRAAAALQRALERLGVAVAGRPGSGEPPAGLTAVARAPSPPLRALLARMLRPSDNFAAEVLGKRLAVATSGRPGSIARAADAIAGWARDNGVEVEAYDASGLSYANRVTAEGIVRLLWMAEGEPWGGALFRALPSGGQGTLEHRLRTVRVRAKTGTLSGISALSGWVWLERLGAWGEFSILSQGMSKQTASEIEDRIVRILQNHAR
jgi:D-alanyl-D-alanine carboxypeptidase/D-alanyl-D-alanine-endopeptidase (penicillin-binding protein 4)